jgi:hypothetical protein
MITEDSKTLSCGLVMPISAIDGCTAEHWSEVKSIITEAVESIADPSFSVRLVSDADDIGVIQKRIVQNIYSSDIIVCDVSGKNPNVMFELGMRLAFDKPTVIVKDDKTDYSFDTGIIEHVPYPRDLRFNRVVIFKAVLAEKVTATYKISQTSPDHSTFLKNFGKFQVASLNETVIPAEKVVVEMLSDLQAEIENLRRTLARKRGPLGRKDLSYELFPRIHLAIADYLQANPDRKLSPLKGNPEFYTYIYEKAILAPYFDSFKEFQDTVDRLLYLPDSASQ